jgi:multidrug efflux system outer membrane protein
MSKAMRHSPRYIHLLAILLLAAPLCGCTVGPDFKALRADIPPTWRSSTVPQAAGQVGQVTEGPADGVAWWTRFGDPELTSLVERAAAANLDAKAAVLRIAEARAQRDVTQAAQWPSLSLNASAQTIRLSESTPTGALFSKSGKLPGPGGVGVPNPYTQDQLGFDASWEIDLFGRVRRSVEAANADTEASLEDSRAVRVAMLGDVGRAYIDLRGAQARRALVGETIATDQDLLSLAGDRRRAGLSSEIDVARAAAEVSSAQALMPLVDRQIAQDVNQLSKLLAREAGALNAELEVAAPIPQVPPEVPIGLPADLARRRPDIRAAEQRLHAATARVGVAVADLFPRVALGAQGGLQAQSLSTLTEWASRFVTAGSSLQLPIFDAGRRHATVRLQDLRAKAAALDYRRTVLAALDEVDNALIAYAADQSRRALLASAVVSNREAVEFARQRYVTGLGNFIDVLDADRSLQQGEIALSDNATAVSADLVLLYRALGGSWG